MFTSVPKPAIRDQSPRPVLVDNATVPVIDAEAAAGTLIYANPLPHVLTVTAIVVQVATLGVSLAIVSAIYRKFGSLHEQEVLEKEE